jgi:sulfite dehydrogenase
VRYHLGDVPLDIDPDKFSVEVKGKLDKPTKLSLADIKKMPAVELVAVNQCSGNVADFSCRGLRAANLAMAPWAMRDGRAFR